MKRETKEILARVIEIDKELAVRKALYDELDMLTMQLQAEGFVDAEFEGLLIQLVDNFAKGNTCFRVAGVKHYELKMKRAKI